jgi:hypothetical protein
MNSFLLTGLFRNNRTAPTKEELRSTAQGRISESTLRETSFPVVYRPEGEKDLRSVVARRFLWMSEAHDRIRTKVLASYPYRAR